MTRKRNKDNDGIKRISGTGSTKGVQRTQGVSEVEKVEKTSAVTKVAGVSKVSEASRVSAVRFEQREKLFSMISEEAQKLAAQGIIPKNQREVVERAVQMVIDAALLENNDEGSGKDKK
jgi:hypothetical protein